MRNASRHRQRGMLRMPLLGLAGGETNSYVAASSDFPGSTATYLARGGALTGVADGKKGILSFWLRADDFSGASALPFFLHTGDQAIKCRTNSSGAFTVDLYNTAGSNFLSSTTTSTTSISQWAHVLFSWNTDVGIWTAKNGVLEGFTSYTIGTSISYTDATNWFIGIDSALTQDYNGLLSEYYLNTVDSLDLSNSYNIKQFIKARKPTNIGANGSVPTGAQPIIYMPTLDNAGANAGSGGAFTENGTISSSSNQPVVGT